MGWITGDGVNENMIRPKVDRRGCGCGCGGNSGGCGGDGSCGGSGGDGSGGGYSRILDRGVVGISRSTELRCK